MKKEFNEKLDSIIAHLGDDKMSRALRSVPLQPNDVITFTGETSEEKATIENNGKKTVVPYGVFLTAEGINVAFSQIARRNNGLDLKSKSFGDAVKEFAALIPDDGLKVRIADVRRIESSFSAGKSTYFIFEIEEKEEEEQKEEQKEEQTAAE